VKVPARPNSAAQGQHRNYTLQDHENEWLYEEAEALTDFDRELSTAGSLDETLRRLERLLVSDERPS
jgi:hypothetical protein